MTDRIQQFQSHVVHSTLKNLGNALSDSEVKAAEVDEAPAALARLQHVADFAVRRLDRADPLLVGEDRLDLLNKMLTQVAAQVRGFATNGSIGHLNNANNEADKLLPTLATFLVPDSPEDIEAVRSSLEAFGRVAKEQIEALSANTTKGNESVKRLQADVQQLQETIKNEKARIDQAITQHQQQFSEAQDSRQQSFSNEEKQRMEKAEANLKSWGDKLSALQDQSKKDFNELVAGIESEWKEKSESASQAAATLLQEIEARRDKAKDLVGIIAGTGMAGGYQKDADEQRKAFLFWNVATILGFAGLIGFAIWLFVASTGEGEFGWSKTFARLLAIVAFGLFAAYAGRMAMKHRESERQHRHKQLALESVNAFLEDLELDVQKQVKQKMAEVFFTQPQGISDTGQDVAPTTIAELFKLLSRAIDKLGK